MKKNCRTFLTLIYKEYFLYLSNIVSNLFPFALAYTMPQKYLAASSSHKNMERLQKSGSKTKKCRILRFLEKLNIKRILNVSD